MGSVERHATRTGAVIARPSVVGVPYSVSAVVFPAMLSNPDTLAKAKENFRKRQEGYRRWDDPDNLYKHPVVKWVPRLGSRVLTGK